MIRSSKRVRLTPKQANIYVWGWQPSARFRTAVCGRRFGKTYLCMEEIRRAVRLAIERDVDTDNEIWYGAPTLKQAKKNFWRRLKRSIPPSWIAKINETECTVTMRSGHVARIVGLDNYDDLRGSGLWFFIGDEWADVKPEAWEETIQPMLSTAGGHALFIGTPKGFNHLYSAYVDGQPGGRPNAKSWSYTTLQGGNVPPEEVEEARRTKDPRTFRQEYEASFETFAGQVYYAFDRRLSVKPCVYDDSLPIHVGMDFNINPMSATIWQERPDGELWQVDEIEIPTSGTHDMAAEIASRFGRPGFDPQRPQLDHIIIYPDPAGAARRTSAQGETDLSILRKAGFRVVAMTTHPLVRDRVNVVNAKLLSADGKRHAFIDPRCRRSIECLEKQIYKEGTSEPDKDGGFDHLNDATGYYLYTRFAYTPAHGARIHHMGR